MNMAFTTDYLLPSYSDSDSRVISGSPRTNPLSYHYVIPHDQLSEIGRPL